jgi:putative colanic acid biosynthesis glycosyltransferase WcaI
MHILMIAPYYAPDLGPSAPLYTMLSRELVHRGHKVTVIAAVPHYPDGIVPKAFRTKNIQFSTEDGVDIIRVRLPSVDRSRLGKRSLQFFAYQLAGTWAGLSQKYDVVISANPALWVWLPFAYLVVFRHKPAIYSVHDLYPNVGVNLGVFRNKFVINLVGGFEKFCLGHSQTVRILSDSFRPGLRDLGVPDAKMSLVYDWVDTELIHPLPQNNPFAQEYGLSDRFVILYAGNLGLSQGLEQLLTTAKMLVDDQAIRFVFVGDGSGSEALKDQAKKLNLSNVQFIPFQPRARLPEVLASASISLVLLRHGIGLDSLPSKTFSIMASGRPMIVSVDENSETHKLVEKADAGLWVPPEDPGKIASAVLQLKQDETLREQLGRNGRSWAEQHHSPQHAAEQFEQLLFEAISLRKLQANRKYEIPDP